MSAGEKFAKNLEFMPTEIAVVRLKDGASETINVVTGKRIYYYLIWPLAGRLSSTSCSLLPFANGSDQAIDSQR